MSLGWLRPTLAEIGLHCHLKHLFFLLWIDARKQSVTVYPTDHLNNQKAKVRVLLVLCARFLLSTQFSNWDSKRYLNWSIEWHPHFFFCCTVNFFCVCLSCSALCVLFSKYSNICWKQTDLALRADICFHNIFCPAKQLHAMHLVHVFLGIFCRRMLGFGQRNHSISTMVIYLATFL